MKQELISTGLAFADFVHRHPKRISAAIAILLIAVGSAGDRGSDRLVAILTPLFVLSLVELLHRLNGTEQTDT